MSLPIRRVVTGHDEQGNAVVKIDEVVSHWRDGRPGARVCNVWTTDTMPADNSGDADGGKREGKFTMIHNGSVFRILEFKPGLEARMHRTDSIDYIVVMSGEIDMELDNGVEVHIKAGTRLVLEVGASKITMDPASITIEAGKITLQGTALIEEKAPLITLN